MRRMGRPTPLSICIGRFMNINGPGVARPTTESPCLLEIGRVNGGTQRLLLVKGIAGLGNRVLALLTAALYGELLGRQTCVDWSDAVFAPEGDAETKHVNLFPLLFDSPTLAPWAPEMAREDVLPEVWRDKLGMTAANVSRQVAPQNFRDFGVFHRSSIDVARTDHEAALLVIWAWRERVLPMRRHLGALKPELRGLSDTELLRRLAAKHLRPSQRIQERVDQLWSAVPEGPSVGLHIRHSDMKAPVEPLVRRAERAIAKMEASSVILATDNADVETLVRSRIGDNLVHTVDKQFADPGVPLHYDATCRDRIQRASEALTDMVMLSRCEHLVYASRSSFGYVAHVLSDSCQTVEDSDRFNPRIQGKRLVQKYWYR